MKRLNIRIEDDLYALVESRAEASDITMTDALKAFIIDGINAQSFLANQDNFLVSVRHMDRNVSVMLDMLNWMARNQFPELYAEEFQSMYDPDGESSVLSGARQKQKEYFERMRKQKFMD